MAVRIKSTAVSGNSNEPLDHSAYSRSLAGSIARRFTPAAAALGIFAGSTVHAATITVNSTADNNPPNEGDGDCTLREAINAMNNSATTPDCPNDTGDDFGTNDEILFDSSLSGSTITLGGTPLPTITQALRIIGPDPGNPAGISLNGNGTSRILKAEGPSGTPFAFDIEVQNLTLTGGKTTDINEGGGALNVSNADLTLINTQVTGNATEGESACGGGVYAYNGSADIDQSTISDNKTEGNSADGGGLCVVSGFTTLQNTTVSNNRTYGNGAEGGGAWISNHVSNGKDQVINSTVSGNSTLGQFSEGGGLYLSTGYAEITNSTVSGNSTIGEESTGGGIHLQTGDITVERSNIEGNYTKGYAARGGGLYVYGGNATVNNSTVMANFTEGEVGQGGGVSIKNGNASLSSAVITGNHTKANRASGGGIRVIDGTTHITKSTVSGNSTKGDAGGGGISIFSDKLHINRSTVSQNSTSGTNSNGGGIEVISGEANVVNSTISGNMTTGSFSEGGGLSVDGVLTLRFTTVAFNVATQANANGLYTDDSDTLNIFQSLVVQSDSTETACNLPADDTSSSYASDSSCGVTVDTPAKIGLQPLAFNGGPTQTHALDPGSVAIDAVPETHACTFDPIGGLTPDQRSFARPVDGDNDSELECDSGAFEFGIETDKGDAPAPYPTLLADNGAIHWARGPILGGSVDSNEADGQPDEEAGIDGIGGDDGNHTDDEDGVIFTSTLTPGADATIDVTMTNETDGVDDLLSAWVDLNIDGDWDDKGEQVLTDIPLSEGSNTGIQITIPTRATSGATYARFRLSTSAGLGPTDVANNGEVEDYQVFIGPEPTVMFNDALIDPIIKENAGTFGIADAVKLSNPSTQEITVDIGFDGSSSTAEIPADFDFAPKTVTFAPGETSAAVEVTVVDDTEIEEDETATFILSNPTNAALGMPASMTATIEDNDDEPSSDSGDDSQTTEEDDDDDHEWYEVDIPGCSMAEAKSSKNVDPSLPLLALASLLTMLRRKIRLPAASDRD